MASIGLTPESFKQLPKDGARFEALIGQLLEAMGYAILKKPAVGTEGGCDVLVERKLKDPMIETSERVVVQCKHHAHSGKAVSEREVSGWQNAMNRYHARGYLLVTDTHVTENVNRAFREFTKDKANYPKWAGFWDVDEVITHLNKQDVVRETFFPTGVLQTWVGEQISRSPFGFESILKEAKKKIFVAGQVLHHLTEEANEKRYKSLVFGVLGNGIRVHVMLCDTDKKDSVHAWQTVVGKEYESQLKHSTITFQKWLEEANEQRLTGLEIRRTALVPLTITFIDPDENYGMLVFIPVVYDPRAELRPCFSIIRKDHPKVFDYYWKVYKKVFEDKKRSKRV